MKKVIIRLIQGAAILEFSAEIETQKITEIAGTLAARIIALNVKQRKYSVKLGFSFARKFDVEIVIDGKAANGSKDLLNGLVKFGITIQQNELSYNRFAGFVSELVEEILTGKNQLEGEFSELVGELHLN